MDASHFDVGTVYAAVNRFRLDDLHPHIFAPTTAARPGSRSWRASLTTSRSIPCAKTPSARGFCFAGTENTVYVSYDDGDHWQSLR